MEHDTGYKRLFSHPEMVADLLRGFVHEPWVERLDLSTLEPVSGSYVSDDLREREDDIVWRARWGDGWVYVYLLLEFQSTVDRYMAVRLLTYVGLLYQDLIKAGATTAEGLLPPVLPLVLYNGERRWSAPTELADLIVPVPGGLEAYRPDFRYLLLDEGAFGQSELTADRNLAAALFAMEHSRRPEDVQAVVHRLGEWLQAPEQRALRRAFSVWLGRVLIPGRFGGEDLPPTNDLKEMETMLAERVKEWQQEWLEQGKQQGMEQGMQQGMQQGEASVLLRLVERKFGAEAAAAHRERIENADTETLLQWSERILTAASVEELFR
jgi:predicted transposase YdaD